MTGKPKWGRKEHYYLEKLFFFSSLSLIAHFKTMIIFLMK